MPYCESVRDCILRDLLREILDDTAEHIDSLKTQLERHANIVTTAPTSASHHIDLGETARPLNALALAPPRAARTAPGGPVWAAAA